MAREFKIGDKVRVRGERGTAHIVAFYKDIDGGVKLDRPINGFVSWNVEDLLHA